MLEHPDTPLNTATQLPEGLRFVAAWAAAGHMGSRAVLAEMARLGAEVARLRADRADWEAAARTAAGEDCPPAERHCTCVPLLRGELARLRGQLDRRPSAG